MTDKARTKKDSLALVVLGQVSREHVSGLEDLLTEFARVAAGEVDALDVAADAVLEARLLEAHRAPEEPFAVSSDVRVDGLVSCSDDAGAAEGSVVACKLWHTLHTARHTRVKKSKKTKTMTKARKEGRTGSYQNLRLLKPSSDARLTIKTSEIVGGVCHFIPPQRRHKFFGSHKNLVMGHFFTGEKMRIAA